MPLTRKAKSVVRARLISPSTRLLPKEPPWKFNLTEGSETRLLGYAIDHTAAAAAPEYHCVGPLEASRRSRL